MPARPTCITCPFWSEALAEGESAAPPDVSPDERIGECRRHAPHSAMDRVIKEQDYSDFPTWPQTMGIEWCGEHPLFARWMLPDIKRSVRRMSEDQDRTRTAATKLWPEPSILDRIYLAAGPLSAAVIVARSAREIDRAGLSKTLGSPVEVHEVGRAHSDTPPGPLLCGPRAELEAARRPAVVDRDRLGRAVYLAMGRSERPWGSLSGGVREAHRRVADAVLAEAGAMLPGRAAFVAARSGEVHLFEDAGEARDFLAGRDDWSYAAAERAVVWHRKGGAAEGRS